MTQCRVIGLTGGIATGKSTVSNIIKNRYRLIDADKIAKDIVKRDKKGYNMVVEHFGNSILQPDGEIDRQKLAEKIFTSPEERKALNQLLHPLIMEKLKREIDKFSEEDYLFLDIPLLFELEKSLEENGILFDEIWLVYSDLERQLTRLMTRDNIDREYALKKIGSQIPLAKKVKKSDKIIYNNASIEDLNSYVEVLLNNLD